MRNELQVGCVDRLICGRMSAPRASSSVLVAAGVPVQPPHAQAQRWEMERCGGSGFVWRGEGAGGAGEGACVVVTSAKWLANILLLKPSHQPRSMPGSGFGSIPDGVEWELTSPETVFHVISENPLHQRRQTSINRYQIRPTATTHDKALPNATKHEQQMIASWKTNHKITKSESGLLVSEAEILSVRLMRDVYCCFIQQMQQLRQWKCGVEAGGEGKQEKREGDNFISVESLLLPLSCAVFLKVKQLKRLSPRWGCGYSPEVGDPLLAMSTPFGTFCPEVFHNTVTSGCVCKLIGWNGNVFVTDACHLPGTEGAGLRLPRSAAVVAMVLSPLFTERGHPTGLSLATPLSSLLPRPQLSLPHPHIQLSALQPQLGVHRSRHSDAHVSSREQGACKLVVAIATSSTWGSGILLASDRVLTCAHVVQPNANSISVYLPGDNSIPPHTGSILEWNKDMDAAILELRPAVQDSRTLELIREQLWSIARPLPTTDSKPLPTPSTAAPATVSGTAVAQLQCHNKPQEYQGKPVYAIGYEAPPWSTRGHLQPLVTHGLLCKVVRGRCGEGVMLVTSAVVLSGMSGGVIVSAEDGRLLGMVVSNSEDMDTGQAYSNVNYSLSLPWLLPSIATESGGSQRGQRLLTREGGEEVKRLWSLRTELALPSSKL